MLHAGRRRKAGLGIKVHQVEEKAGQRAQRGQRKPRGQAAQVRKDDALRCSVTGNSLEEPEDGVLQGWPCEPPGASPEHAGMTYFRCWLGAGDPSSFRRFCPPEGAPPG